MNKQVTIQKYSLSLYGLTPCEGMDVLLLPDDSADILLQLQYKELLLQLVQALKTLPDTCRETCWLYYEEGLTKKQISNRLNISLSTVHNRLTWGLHLLKTQFAKKPKNPV